MPTINKPFLLKLVLVIGVLTGALFAVHAVQADRIPGSLKRQAERAAEDGKLDMAIHYCRQYLEFIPDDVDVQVQLVGLLRKRNPAGRAQAEVIFLYDRILRQDPDRHDIRREALMACLRMGRSADAVAHAEALLKAFPGDAKLWEQLGSAQVALNQLPEARRSFEAAIARDPGEMLGYQRLAQLVWRNMNDPPGARDVLDRMVKAMPRNPDAYLVRGRFEMFLLDEPGAARGDTKRAAADFQRVLELDPENADASLHLAEVYQRERNIPAAHALLRDAVALYPRDLRLVRNLSWLELVRGNAPAAIAVLEDGLKATPDGFDLLIPLADLLVQQGDATRTAQILKRLETHKAPAIQVKYLKARVAMRDGKWADAVALLEALRGEVTNLPGLEVQLNLLLAVCAGNLADFAAEEKAYQRVIHDDPKNVQARTGLGNLYLALGKFDEATRELEVAAQSPYATGAVVAQWIRTKTRRLRAANAPADDWRKLEVATAGAAGRFGPVSSEPVMLLAEVMLAQGKSEEAIQLMRKETARRPGDARLWAVLAGAVADAGGTPAGLAVVDEAQAAAGDGVDVRLARARLYAGEPGRVRPVAPLAERIESWSEADQLRLLFGLLEVFDHVGDQPGVVQMLRRIAGRRPTDAAVWVKLHERASQIGDAKSAAEARSTLVKLEGESGPSVLLCDAATAPAADAAKLIDRLVAAFGATPTRPDACLALARLYGLAGKADDAARMTERAFALEPTRYDAAKAWLVHLGNNGPEERAQRLVTRLATDPRWAGEPFRRLVTAVVPTVPTPMAANLLTWSRPHVERDPGALGWLAETADRYRVFDPVPVLLEATARPNATADDWLQLALTRGPDDLKAARGKLPVPAYLAAAAVFFETPAGKDFGDQPANPAERRLFAQSRLAVKLSRGKPEEAAKVLEEYVAGKDIPPADLAWGRRNLAMLYAVGGTPEDRQRAMQLIKDAAFDAGSTAEDLRATAGVLTTLARYLEGADRITVLTRAAVALDAAYKRGNSPKDLFNLSQLYRSAGNRADSRKCLQALLNSDPKNIYYLVAAVEELTEDQDYAAAGTFAAKLLAEHPGEFQAVAAVARLECKAGRPGAALALAEKYAQAAEPGAGDHLTRNGRVAELLDELARLPNVRGTPAGRAITDAAVERYAALVQKHPEAVIGIVGALAADGRAADGFARLERLGKVIPDRVRAAAGLAAVRAGTVTERQATAVQAWIESCLAEDPASPTLLLNRAEFLALRQDLTGAAAEYEKIIAADPRNVVALNNLAWILAADPRTAEKALTLVAQATREVGLTGDLLDTRARVRITLKQFEQAERDLDDAIRLEPTALRWFHLALSRLGQTPPKQDDAVKAFREARRRGLDPRGVHPADLPAYGALDAGNKKGN
jgi:tetratricopeptide (TPR) repeat protein